MDQRKSTQLNEAPSAAEIDILPSLAPSTAVSTAELGSLAAENVPSTPANPELTTAVSSAVGAESVASPVNNTQLPAETPSNTSEKPAQADVSLAKKRRFLLSDEELPGSRPSRKIFKAYDSEEGVEVAVHYVYLSSSKLQLPKGDIDDTELLSRLRSSDLVNDHLIRIIDTWLEREDFAIVYVTPIVTAGTLQHYIARIDDVRFRVVRKWCRQILSGLEHMHEKGYAHGDLRLPNIYINGETGNVVLGQHIVGRTLDSSTLSRVIRSTAPELDNPSADSYPDSIICTPAGDVWAFGLCVLEMVTRKLPWSQLSAVKETELAEVVKEKKSGHLPPEFFEFCKMYGVNLSLFAAGHEDQISEESLGAESETNGSGKVGPSIVDSSNPMSVPSATILSTSHDDGHPVHAKSDTISSTTSVTSTVSSSNDRDKILASSLAKVIDSEKTNDATLVADLIVQCLRVDPNDRPAVSVLQKHKFLERREAEDAKEKRAVPSISKPDPSVSKDGVAKESRDSTQKPTVNTNVGASTSLKNTSIPPGSQSLGTTKSEKPVVETTALDTNDTATSPPSSNLIGQSTNATTENGQDSVRDRRSSSIVSVKTTVVPTPTSSISAASAPAPIAAVPPAVPVLSKSLSNQGADASDTTQSTVITSNITSLPSAPAASALVSGVDGTAPQDSVASSHTHNTSSVSQTQSSSQSQTLSMSHSQASAASSTGIVSTTSVTPMTILSSISQRNVTTSNATITGAAPTATTNVANVTSHPTTSNNAAAPSVVQSIPVVTSTAGTLPVVTSLTAGSATLATSVHEKSTSLPALPSHQAQTQVPTPPQSQQPYPLLGLVFDTIRFGRTHVGITMRVIYSAISTSSSSVVTVIPPLQASQYPQGSLIYKIVKFTLDLEDPGDSAQQVCHDLISSRLVRPSDSEFLSGLLEASVGVYMRLPHVFTRECLEHVTSHHPGSLHQHHSVHAHGSHVFPPVIGGPPSSVLHHVGHNAHSQHSSHSHHPSAVHSTSHAGPGTNYHTQISQSHVHNSQSQNQAATMGSSFLILPPNQNQNQSQFNPNSYGNVSGNVSTHTFAQGLTPVTPVGPLASLNIPIQTSSSVNSNSQSNAIQTQGSSQSQTSSHQSVDPYRLQQQQHLISQTNLGFINPGKSHQAQPSVAGFPVLIHSTTQNLSGGNSGMNSGVNSHNSSSNNLKPLSSSQSISMKSGIVNSSNTSSNVTVTSVIPNNTPSSGNVSANATPSHLSAAAPANVQSLSLSNSLPSKFVHSQVQSQPSVQPQPFTRERARTDDDSQSRASSKVSRGTKVSSASNEPRDDQDGILLSEGGSKKSKERSATPAHSSGKNPSNPNNSSGSHVGKGRSQNRSRTRLSSNGGESSEFFTEDETNHTSHSDRAKLDPDSVSVASRDYSDEGSENEGYVDFDGDDLDNENEHDEATTYATSHSANNDDDDDDDDEPNRDEGNDDVGESDALSESMDSGSNSRRSHFPTNNSQYQSHFQTQSSHGNQSHLPIHSHALSNQSYPLSQSSHNHNLSNSSIGSSATTRINHQPNLTSSSTTTHFHNLSQTTVTSTVGDEFVPVNSQVAVNVAGSASGPSTGGYVTSAANPVPLLVNTASPVVGTGNGQSTPNSNRSGVTVKVLSSSVGSSTNAEALNSARSASSGVTGANTTITAAVNLSPSSTNIISSAAPENSSGNVNLSTRGVISSTSSLLPVSTTSMSATPTPLPVTLPTVPVSVGLQRTGSTSNVIVGSSNDSYSSSSNLMPLISSGNLVSSVTASTLAASITNNLNNIANSQSNQEPRVSVGRGQGQTLAQMAAHSSANSFNSGGGSTPGGSGTMLMGMTSSSSNLNLQGSAFIPTLQTTGSLVPSMGPSTPSPMSSSTPSNLASVSLSGVIPTRGSHTMSAGSSILPPLHQQSSFHQTGTLGTPSNQVDPFAFS